MRDDVDLLVEDALYRYRDRHNGHYPQCVVIHPFLYRSLTRFSYCYIKPVSPPMNVLFGADLPDWGNMPVTAERCEVKYLMMDVERIKQLTGRRVIPVEEWIQCLDIVQFMDMLKIQEDVREREEVV